MNRWLMIGNRQVFLFAILGCISAFQLASAQQVIIEPVQDSPDGHFQTKVFADSPGTVVASCDCETAEFADVIRCTQTLANIHGPEQVLLVLDIDNTILATNQVLGSDQWYNWQYDFIYKGIESPERVARDLDELLQIQGSLFALSRMHPPEPQLPDFIRQVQALGCCTIVLTSRSPAFRNSSERELRRNGYDFSTSALKIKEIDCGRFLPYDKSQPGAFGLSGEELAKLRAPRPVSYSNGIMMTAGQHKGYMLRSLLARTNRTFKTIVFADDHRKHTSRMSAAFADSDVSTTCFRYSQQDPAVAKFNESDKRQAVEQWRVLDAVLKETFPEVPVE